MMGLDGVMFEVNDASQLAGVAGKPHAAGPFLNVYNEDALCYLAHRGAEVFCLPAELPGSSVKVMGACAAKHGVAVETQVFGRIPLALSARCYHARAHGLTKDGCQFVCERDPDGMVLKTLDGAPFLTINGIQTMSYRYLNLIRDLERLSELGVSRFRLSPDSGDMLAVARLFRDVLDRVTAPAEAMARLSHLRPGADYADGFFHQRPGTTWSNSGKSGNNAVGGEALV
jgi:collagenase-like PrtC family protease